METCSQNALPPKSDAVPRTQYVEIDIVGNTQPTIPIPPISLIKANTADDPNSHDKIIAEANRINGIGQGKLQIRAGA